MTITKRTARHRADGRPSYIRTPDPSSKKWPLSLVGLTLMLAVILSGCGPTTDVGASDTGSSTSQSKSAPSMTVAQRQALKSAQSYIDMGSFSKAGLYNQLTSKAGDGFKEADARYAVAHVKADWNKQAVQSAKTYMEMGGFSRSSLIHQLHSKAGDGFTLKQAEYAADKVGLK